MISVDSVEKSAIRHHYQLGTVFYRLLWGPHIHHGLWTADESASVAQCQLTDTLADLGRITGADRVVDIGCGMGGSAIRMAKLRGCDVTGVTLSPLQRSWAATSARVHGVRDRTRFIAADAEQVDFEANSFDVLWSVECTEHLFDKPAFFQRAAHWLRPGGRISVAVWFEGADSSRPTHREQVEDVCRRFVCPSLGTRNDYAAWMQEAGLRIAHNVDWTERAARTWEICERRVARTGLRHAIRWLDRKQLSFLNGFEVLLEAYRSGAMQYGAIVAEKPDQP